MRMMRLTGRRAVGEVDSVYAWLRLLAGVLTSTIGGVGMWSIAVVLPTLQADFGVTRADVSLAYTAVMLGAVVGGPVMGWLSDRFGITVPVAIGTAMLALGLALASQAATMWQFTLVHGLLIGGGTSASFGPVIADISLWFAKRRGVAVAICSSGSYLAGTVWPLVIQPLAQWLGWRHSYFGIAVFCLCSMLPLLLALRRRLPREAGGHSAHGFAPRRAFAGGGNGLQLLLMLAGVACCIAMAMPQVHIVAYCTDLGYGPARGAEMLSLMFGTGIISRLSFGWIADRIGPAPALIISSSLQAASLLAYFGANGPVDAAYPIATAIKIILDNHSAHVSRETKAWLAARPEARFRFVFTPKHGSWLNLVEGFFAKAARSMLRHIRVNSKHELKQRITEFINDLNRDPVVHRWHYQIDLAA